MATVAKCVPTHLHWTRTVADNRHGCSGNTHSHNGNMHGCGSNMHGRGGNMHNCNGNTHSCGSNMHDELQLGDQASLRSLLSGG